jgi:urease accessory protein
MGSRFTIMTSRTSLRAFLPAALLIAPALAQAHPGHPGHDDDFLRGVAHPLSGLDHTFALLAVGLWAAQLGGRARWVLPTSFVAVMALAGAAGMGGAHVPMLEQGMVASVFVLGALVAMSATLPLGVALGFTSLFAAFHGLAHGAGLAGQPAALSAAAGMLLSSVALLACGVTLGSLLRASARQLWLRAAGVAVMVAFALSLA